MNRHIAFIDSNLIGVYALDMAKDMGHAVTFIHSSDIHRYTRNKDYGRIISRVDRTIEMETTSDEDALCLILKKIAQASAHRCGYDDLGIFHPHHCAGQQASGPVIHKSAGR